MRTEVIVDHELCDLCNRCVRYCPGDILRVDSGRVGVEFAGECWVCGICELECPQDCIEVQFGFLT